MSYIATEWATGDTITAEKLNKLEQGVAGAGGTLVVLIGESSALNKTWQDIYDAALGGSSVVIHGWHNGSLMMAYNVLQITSNDSTYTIAAYNGTGTTYFDATSADGYPTLRLGGQ